METKMPPCAIYLLILIPWLGLFGLFPSVTGLAIDNLVAEEPQVQCSDDSVTFSFRTRNRFTGNVFIKGKYNIPQCRQEYFSNSFTGASFTVKIGECGMRRIRQLTPHGMNYVLVFVVNFHSQFITKVDRAYNVRCFYAQVDKQVTNQIEISMIATTELRVATMVSPNCAYTVRSGNLNGPVIRFARVGDRLVHRWECDNPAFGMLVKNCFVNDGQGNSVRVLDPRGCPVFSPVIQGTLNYDGNLNLAFVEVWAYKFPDRANLFFQCQIQICNKRENECAGVTPPNCPISGALHPSEFTNDVPGGPDGRFLPGSFIPDPDIYDPGPELPPPYSDGPDRPYLVNRRGASDQISREYSESSELLDARRRNAFSGRKTPTEKANRQPNRQTDGQTSPSGENRADARRFGNGKPLPRFISGEARAEVARVTAKQLAKFAKKPFTKRPRGNPGGFRAVKERKSTEREPYTPRQIQDGGGPASRIQDGGAVEVRHFGRRQPQKSRFAGQMGTGNRNHNDPSITRMRSVLPEGVKKYLDEIAAANKNGVLNMDELLKNEGNFLPTGQLYEDYAELDSDGVGSKSSQKTYDRLLGKPNYADLATNRGPPRYIDSSTVRRDTAEKLNLSVTRVDMEMVPEFRPFEQTILRDDPQNVGERSGKQRRGVDEHEPKRRRRQEPYMDDDNTFDILSDEVFILEMEDDLGEALDSDALAQLRNLQPPYPVADSYCVDIAGLGLLVSVFAVLIAVVVALCGYICVKQRQHQLISAKLGPKSGRGPSPDFCGPTTPDLSRSPDTESLASIKQSIFARVLNYRQ